MKRQRYFVTGAGTFPNDMLRYDQATIIGKATVLGRPAFLIDGYRTDARWQSFLWACFDAAQHYPAGDSERGPVLWKVRIQDKWESVAVSRYEP